MFIFDCFTPELFQETLVLLHHHKTLQLLVEFETDRNDNEHSGCRHGSDQRIVSESDESEQQAGNKSDERKVNCAEQRDTLGDLIQKFVSGLAGTSSGDKSAVLLQVSCNFVGLELKRSVEVAERQYQKSHCDGIQPGAGTHIFVPPKVQSRVGPEDLTEHLRESDDGGCKDDGHDAACVYFDRDVGILTAVLLSAFNLLCILDGNSSFGKVYEDDKTENENCHQDEAEQGPDCKLIAVDNVLNGSDQCEIRGRQDSDEDEKGDTVTDTDFGNSLAHPG